MATLPDHSTLRQTGKHFVPRFMRRIGENGGREDVGDAISQKDGSSAAPGIVGPRTSSASAAVRMMQLGLMQRLQGREDKCSRLPAETRLPRRSARADGGKCDPSAGVARASPTGADDEVAARRRDACFSVSADQPPSRYALCVSDANRDATKWPSEEVSATLSEVAEFTCV